MVRIMLSLGLPGGLLWGWCCMFIYLVWMDYKCLGYRGLDTVVVIREEINMMMFIDWD